MKNKKVMLFTIVVIAVSIVSLLGCTEMVDSNYEKPQEIDNIFVEDSVIYKYRNSAVDPADDYDDYHAQMAIDHRIEYEDGMISYDEAAKITGKEIDYFFPQADISQHEFILDLVSYDYIDEGAPEYHSEYIEPNHYVFQMALNAYSGDVRVINFSDRTRNGYVPSDNLTEELEAELLNRCILLADKYGYSDYQGYYLKQQSGTIADYRLMLILNETEALRFEFNYVDGNFHRQFFFERTAVDPRIATMDGAKDMVVEAINNAKPISVPSVE